MTQAAQNEKILVYYQQQPGPLGSSRYRVSGGVLEPSPTRLTGDVTIEVAEDEWERSNYRQESKSVWMNKIKHKCTFGGSRPSSIIRVSPFFICEFSSVSSYELEKKETDDLSFDFAFAWLYDWFKRWALRLIWILCTSIKRKLSLHNTKYCLVSPHYPKSQQVLRSSWFSSSATSFLKVKKIWIRPL